ncbi:RHS repeat-associated core domain-containing protein [Novipirellula sp.]|uniref:RHS repeat-associated core domain-containing protein n=1 Tax=Novipirellula sp. TaxID=2795430 RepID=UPI00356458CA
MSSENLVRYYPCGQQYSITALTDSSGTIKERYAYDAYGNLSIFDGSGTARTSTAESNRYTYTGREYDDVLDLYHYRARMYDSIAGRFCSRDPISFDGSRWNLFEYCGCSPVLRVDPRGERWQTWALTCGNCAAVLGPGALTCIGANETFDDSWEECMTYYVGNLPWIHRQAAKVACAGCVIRIIGPPVYRWVLRHASSPCNNTWEQIAVRSERVIRFSQLIR